MFRALPAYQPDDNLLATIGAPGGLMDGGTPISDAPTMPSGITFLDQFVDHDITSRLVGQYLEGPGTGCRQVCARAMRLSR
jgi:hypothetical protein